MRLNGMYLCSHPAVALGQECLSDRLWAPVGQVSRHKGVALHAGEVYQAVGHVAERVELVAHVVSIQLLPGVGVELNLDT